MPVDDVVNILFYVFIKQVDSMLLCKCQAPED